MKSKRFEYCCRCLRDGKMVFAEYWNTRTKELICCACAMADQPQGRADVDNELPLPKATA